MESYIRTVVLHNSSLLSRVTGRKETVVTLMFISVFIPGTDLNENPCSLKRVCEDMSVIFLDYWQFSSDVTNNDTLHSRLPTTKTS